MQSYELDHEVGHAIRVGIAVDVGIVAANDLVAKLAGELLKLPVPMKWKLWSPSTSVLASTIRRPTSSPPKATLIFFPLFCPGRALAANLRFGWKVDTVCSISDLIYLPAALQSLVEQRSTSVDPPASSQMDQCPESAQLMRHSSVPPTPPRKIALVTTRHCSPASLIICRNPLRRFGPSAAISANDLSFVGAAVDPGSRDE